MNSTSVWTEVPIDKFVNLLKFWFLLSITCNNLSLLYTLFAIGIKLIYQCT